MPYPEPFIAPMRAELTSVGARELRTPEDVDAFRKAGVKYLVTTTPVLEGRSFGTNMMEAALVAISGKGRPLTWPELTEMLDKLGFEPQLQELN